MRAGVMSPGWLAVATEARAAAHDQAAPERYEVGPSGRWKSEDFAREQIHHLVNQVFRPGLENATRQIVFSAVDRETEIGSICVLVGEVLAAETRSEVAVVGELSDMRFGALYRAASEEWPKSGGSLRKTAVQRGRNLWLLPAPEAVGMDRSAVSEHAFLEEVRREFEFSVLQGPAAGVSNGAIVMSQSADGIILVLSAQHTRRAAALKVKRALGEAHVRLLGAVLKDREFPIPERVYRRL